MPTGGVEVEEKNIRSWFDAGVVAVGMGSKLITKPASDNKEFEQIKSSAANAMDLIRRITQKGQ
jgi:2-dehydro-3-deoxyphosphogluconate aldolase/(4S)-4-hydroxy-2-oxoglutarate aldolase